MCKNNRLSLAVSPAGADFGPLLNIW